MSNRKRKVGTVIPIKLKSGKISYKARFQPTGQRPYHKTFSTEKSAQYWVIQEKAKFLKGDHVVEHRKVIIDDYFYKYLEQERLRVQFRTYRGRVGDLKNHILPVVGGKKMVDITFDDAIQLQINMKEKKLNGQTINKVTRLFRKVIKHASTGKGSHRVLDSDPLEGLKSLPEVIKAMEYWSKKEVNYFLNHDLVKNDFYYDFYRAAFNSGMRIGEVAGLQVKKICFDTNIITISNSLKTEEHGYDLGCTKTKKTRYLKMNPVLRKIMLKRTKRKERDDFIFLNENGTQIDIYHFTDRKFRPLQRKIGVRKNVRFHDLRHTFASNYFMEGGNFLSAQEMLGHTSTQTTQGYIHISDKFRQQEADRIQF